MSVLPAMVDVVLPLEGSALPRDHPRALAAALERAVPGLASWPGLGVHRINVVVGVGRVALLSKRARLTLRVHREQVIALAPLSGATLDVAGHELRLGRAVSRELLPHGTLYAHLVTTSDEDEGAFLASIERELQALGVRGRPICGRRHEMMADATGVSGYSLMVDGLSPADSMQLLEAGLGRHRRLGCGVFVPHRSAAALRA